MLSFLKLPTWWSTSLAVLGHAVRTDILQLSVQMGISIDYPILEGIKHVFHYFNLTCIGDAIFLDLFVTFLNWLLSFHAYEIVLVYEEWFLFSWLALLAANLIHISILDVLIFY